MSATQRLGVGKHEEERDAEQGLARKYERLKLALHAGVTGVCSLVAGRDDQCAVIRVRDNGIGIAPDMLARVFDPFVRAGHARDTASEGLGLGLTLARCLTVMHGGTLEARSEGADQGSEFVVRLPILSEPALAGT